MVAVAFGQTGSHPTLAQEIVQAQGACKGSKAAHSHLENRWILAMLPGHLERAGLSVCSLKTVFDLDLSLGINRQHQMMPCLPGSSGLSGACYVTDTA